MSPDLGPSRGVCIAIPLALALWALIYQIVKTVGVL